MKISQYLRKPEVNKTIAEILQSNAHGFITAVISLVNETPELEEVDRTSLLSACVNAYNLNLPLSPKLGYVYILPYNTKAKGKVAQLQIGYKGFIQLALASNKFARINTSDVREGELVGIDRLTGDLTISWIQDDNERNKKKIIGYIAYFKLTTGLEKTLYMTVEQLQQHGAKYSTSYRKGYGLWKDEFDIMAKKTVLKQLLSKYAPLTKSLAQATQIDQSADGVYVDNLPETPEQLAHEKEREWLLEVIDKSTDIQQLEAMKDKTDDDEIKHKIDVRIKSLQIDKML
jgi:recombination protein RecT